MDDFTKERLLKARDIFIRYLQKIRSDVFATTAYADCRTDPEEDEETGMPGLIVCVDWNEVCAVCGNHQTACAAEQRQLILDFGPQVGRCDPLPYRDRLVCMQAIRVLQETKWLKRPITELKEALETGELKDEDYAASLLKAIRPELFTHKYEGDIHRAAKAALNEAGVRWGDILLFEEEYDLIEDLFNIECAWSDVNALCVDCGRLIGTAPDCHDWVPEFKLIDDERVCNICLEEDPHLAYTAAVNQCAHCYPCDPEELGFVLIPNEHDGRWSRGLMGGQNDDMRAQLPVVNDAGFDVLFKVFPSQFYAEWELYARPQDPEQHADKDEAWIVSTVREALQGCGECKTADPATLMQQALRESGPTTEMVREKEEKGGVIVTKINSDTGDHKTELVPHDEFLAGRKSDG